jgi:hypothetical protein
MEPHVQMAVMHRPNDMGIDLPAGSSANDLAPTDYHVIEVPDSTIEWALVHRPNSIGLDLPAGASARDLAPTDYRIIEIEDVHVE